MKRLRMNTVLGPRNKETRIFHKVLTNFLACVKDSYDPRKNRKDCGWWYGERSLTGLLASAGWLLPRFGWSLEEFTGERSRGKSTTGKRKSNKGRGDLWLLLGRSEKSGAFTIEAKVTWPEQVDDVSKWVSRVNKKLDKAFYQLKNLHKDYHYGRPAAVCYVVPAFPKRRKGSNVLKKRLSVRHDY